jgi:hypothetical protein
MKQRVILLSAMVIVGVCAKAQNPGFFLNDWQAKTIAVTEYTDVTKPTITPNVTITVNAGDTITKVSKYLFGNNTNLWMGQMVTETDLMANLSNLKPNLLRAPGGSISDVYFWNSQPDVPPADAPDSIMNADGTKTKSGFWYGTNTAGWTLALDNYYGMLQQTGSKGIIVVNYAYARYGRSANPVAAAAHLAANWVRYDNGRTKFWEIGNENSGSWEAGYRIDKSKNLDGQPEFISGTLYGQHFKIFADSMRAAAQQIGSTIYIGAQLVEHTPQSWEDNVVKNWNSGVIPQVNNAADFYIVHNYYTPYNTNSNATDILNTATSVSQGMMSYVTQNIQSNGGQLKPIALTEFNIFATGSKQAVSHINGMHAAITISELMKSKYGEATRWDLANGWNNGDDHGMFNQGDEPGGVPKWNPRPDFFHLYYLQKFTGDHMVNTSVAGATDVLSYSTLFNSGQAGVVLFNKGLSNQTVKINFQNFPTGNRFYWYTLSGSNDNGEFSGKVLVNGVAPTNATGGPLTYATLKPNSALSNDDVRVTLPARSAMYLLVERNTTVTSVNDIDPASKLVQLLNNPSTDGSFTLRLNGFTFADQFDMNVVDASGKTIYATHFTYSPQVHFKQTLAAGLYYIQVRTKKGMTVKKLLVD